MRARLADNDRPEELIALWRERLLPMLEEGMWLVGGATQPLEATRPLQQQLVELVGEADANALFSGVSEDAHLLASLGPMVGIAQVARGEISRAVYDARYGHRGPNELELAAPRPREDPQWIERRLLEYRDNPVDVEAMLARRQVAFDEAWQRLQQRYPQQAAALRGEIEKVGPAARLREDVRSEITRFYGVLRAWALRAGALSNLGDDIFFLYIEEVLDLLAGNSAATTHIATRKETDAHYRALPPYPTIIRGSFDPFVWATNPARRADIFDARAPRAVRTNGATIRGFAGAAGCVEGVVRLLVDPEEGETLQAGEILVAVTTNVGWTPLFPRAAAVVTDVGAPLSHAAIVARELGIPAVVGCVEATTRLKTGDRVRVDGGQGVVEILNENGEEVRR
jgi:pyruvate,water dikinase